MLTVTLEGEALHRPALHPWAPFQLEGPTNLGTVSR